MKKPPLIAISTNTAWNIANFRSGLIRALKKDGFDVLAIAPSDAYVSQLEELSCDFVSLPIDNKGTNPIKDAVLLLRYLAVFRRKQPDVFLGYTIKPNIYGSLAAHILGIPVINNVSGLGTTFIRDGWLTKLVQLFYRIAFRRSIRVFFQNVDDRNLFVERKIVKPNHTGLLPGSGVDLARFKPQPLPAKYNNKSVHFLLIARLLYDKGVGEYVEAARLLKKRGVPAHCSLLGFLDVENRSAVSQEDVESWVHAGIVNYLGKSDDVRQYIVDADCIVLPSYREGTPRTLLEGAAMGRPLVTTDAPGCREAVDDGVTGYLCPVRNSDELAERMQTVVALGVDGRTRMGAAGRKKMEKQFDEQLVIEAYLQEASKMIGRKVER